MSDLVQKDILKQVNELFLQAEEEERKYNWKKEIEILREIERISLDNKLKDIEGEVYLKLGEIYVADAEFEESEENILNNIQLAISYFQKAQNVFKDLKKEEKVSASLGLIDYLEYLYRPLEGREEILLESAKSHFKKAKLINLENKNMKDSLKMAILENRVLNLFIGEKSIRIDEKIDFMNLFFEFEKINNQIWEELEKGYEISEYFVWYFLESITEFIIWSVSYLSIENSVKIKYITDNINRIKKFIDTIENSSKIVNIFIAYLVSSLLNSILGAYIVDNQFEQKKYIKIAQKWIKKGETLFPKFHINEISVFFYFMRFTTAIFLMYLGYFARDFKHALENLDLMINSIHLHVPKITAATIMIYAVNIFLIGALSRSTPDIQRIDFAKKSLELIELMTIKIPLVNNPNYKIYNLTKNFYLCTAHAILGDLIKDKGESSKHL
ncbi:MAG: hypothetical protein ACFFDN_34240 [Candidatus Hodarchaeota archaeon]